MKRHASAGCVYESVAADNLDELQQENATAEDENKALRSRIADLEAAIADYKSQRRANNQPNKRNRTQYEGKEAEGSDKGVYYGDSYYLGSAAAPDLLQRMSKLVPQDHTDLLGAFAGSSVGALHPGYYAFPTLFGSTQGVKELTNILHNIGRQHCDTLLDVFYDVIDPLHHYVPRKWFMERYERCWAEDRESIVAQEIALVYTVLALGDVITNKSYAVLMIATAMQLLRISNFLANTSMECVAAFCFIGVYLQYEGKLGEFWPVLGMVIRLAQSIALHRDPSAVMKVPEAEAELRRRLWYFLAAQETAVSSMSGRPQGLPSSDCKLPRDISDSELFGPSPNTNHSENSGQNEVSYNRYEWELGIITREILKSASHEAEDTQLCERQAYQTRIEKWLNSLPLNFRYDHNTALPTPPATGQTRDRIVQSITLYCLAQFNILVLYRKTLLVGRPCDVTRKACCEAAFEVADGWRVLQDNYPAMARVTWGHWFLAFHSALICLVVIRTDGPRSSMRPRALDCWAHYLRIFTRIQDQNQSISNCWRALVRLDAVVAREDNKKSTQHRGEPLRQSLQKHQGASLANLLNKSEKEIDATSSVTRGGVVRLSEGQALNPNATARHKVIEAGSGGLANGRLSRSSTVSSSHTSYFSPQSTSHSHSRHGHDHDYGQREQREQREYRRQRDSREHDHIGGESNSLYRSRGGGGANDDNDSYFPPSHSIISTSHDSTHSTHSRNTQSLDSLLGVNMLFGTAAELPTPGFEMQGFDIFDVDAQNWPPWLTAINSSNESGWPGFPGGGGREGGGGGGSGVSKQRAVGVERDKVMRDRP